MKGSSNYFLIAFYFEAVEYSDNRIEVRNYNYSFLFIEQTQNIYKDKLSIFTYIILLELHAFL